MSIEIIKMPKLGMSMTVGKVSEWYFSIGDDVKAGEEIVEVTTEKINHVITANLDGQLRRILVEIDTDYAVETALAVIATADISDAIIDEHLQQIKTL